ncbi:hypothetical protein QAD02_000008 [Eretmocerus hayati]|uniref:Uncharacterized protein n=1 Tax=Eretmocerus hayati TaxID=131215 RepID=A0ACC2NEI8_9HYME|nr:hypothetical protein QAD02_000008 [Eretmocerus hayati]
MADFGLRVSLILLKIIEIVKENLTVAAAAGIIERTSRTAIDCFYFGLHRDIAQFLIGQKFDTPEMAIAAAGEAERLIMQRRELHGGRRAHNDSRGIRRMFVRNIVASHFAPNGDLHPPPPVERELQC